jgi:predicted nucleic acid-binding protein
LECVIDANALLRRRINLSSSQIQVLFDDLTQGINTYPKKFYQPHLGEAYDLAHHEEDAPYLALALTLNVPIWSNDKGIKDQDKVKVFSTFEIVSLLAKIY